MHLQPFFSNFKLYNNGISEKYLKLVLFTMSSLLSYEDQSFVIKNKTVVFEKTLKKYTKEKFFDGVISKLKYKTNIKVLIIGGAGTIGTSYLKELIKLLSKKFNHSRH